MIIFPNAKINLGLNVVETRPDGYHNIETVFCAIPMTDALEIIPAEEDSFQLSGIPIPGDKGKNLVSKALNLLRQQGHNIPPLAVYLLKAIPMEAGLGGGSSDGAFMLRLLNSYSKLNLDDEDLEKAASTLGSDCPFFIRNTPQFATGTGNIFEPVELPLKGMHLVIVKPNESVSTREAYASVEIKKPAISVKDIVKRPISEWRTLLTNDFEKSVFPLHPHIKEIKEKLYQSGAVYASMSGSGSAVYGLFNQKTSLRPFFNDSFFWEGIMP